MPVPACTTCTAHSTDAASTATTTIVTATTRTTATIATTVAIDTRHNLLPQNGALQKPAAMPPLVLSTSEPLCLCVLGDDLCLLWLPHLRHAIIHAAVAALLSSTLTAPAVAPLCTVAPLCRLHVDGDADVGYH